MPTPLCGNRPIVPMMVHQGNSKPIIVYALLDTGYTTPLISNTFVDKWSIPCLPHKKAVAIRNFTGDIVNGAGKRYTKPVLLPYRRHFTQEVFEAAPLEPGVDVFLPFWWIAKHAFKVLGIPTNSSSAPPTV